ncbi:tetracycline repressor [Actinoplanes friuliensis DSM 7358]|uniref:Tetracycline repressor n=2 Tax=Actinoplanes friuliensis TaxID=196914 RepID=U5WA89_9ACTN|nr:tetracycline repressor [Actinoplanes friuliensis DSM 7358]
MRRLAAELGAGVMSLYTYVRDKEELLDLMIEQVSDPGHELDDADLLGLTTWQRALMLRHPWIPEALPNRQLSGPNMLGFLERGLAALSGTGLPGPAKMEILALLTGFVASYVTNELAQARIGVTDSERVREHVDRLRTAATSGDYPELAKVLSQGVSGPPPSFEGIAERMIAGLVTGQPSPST